MKVLLVNGSPHEHGCTDRALQEVKTALENEGVGADIYWIDNAPIPGCLSCMYCVKNHKCVYDDLVNSFVNIAKHYDGFVFGSPVYFASAAGQMVAFMDRVFFSSYAGKTDTFYMKPVASVASCRRAGDVAALDQLNKYYGLMHMPVVSSSYWNEVHGHYNANYRKDGKIKRICFAEGDIAPAVNEPFREKNMDADMMILPSDEADKNLLDGTFNTLVSYTVFPETPENGSVGYLMLIEADTHSLYYYRKQKVSRTETAGFLPSDIKTLGRGRK